MLAAMGLMQVELSRIVGEMMTLVVQTVLGDFSGRLNVSMSKNFGR